MSLSTSTLSAACQHPSPDGLISQRLHGLFRIANAARIHLRYATACRLLDAVLLLLLLRWGLHHLCKVATNRSSFSLSSASHAVSLCMITLSELHLASGALRGKGKEPGLHSGSPSPPCSPIYPPPHPDPLFLLPSLAICLFFSLPLPTNVSCSRCDVFMLRCTFGLCVG